MAKARRRMPTGYDFGQIRLPEYFLSLLLIYEGAGMAGFSFQLITIAVMLLIGLSRPVTTGLENQKWLPIAMALGLFHVMSISFLATPSMFAFDWTRRIVRMAEMFLLVLALGHGQLHIPSVLKGIMTGLLGNAIMFYLRLTPDTYMGALTGWILDKNKAGMFYAILGVLGLIIARKLSHQVLAVVTGATLVWLTESRTSMAAYALGVVWVYVIAPRAAALRWLAGVGMYYLVPWIEANFAQAGSFATRVGSDRLRSRIDAAMDAKVAAASWFGNGLGEAYVMLEQQRWLFHNSYGTLLMEGGWPWTLLIVAMTVSILLRPTRSAEVHFEKRVVQGAGIALLICALRLGEVFITVPWAILMGVALHYLVLTETPCTEKQDDQLPALLDARSSVIPARR